MATANAPQAYQQTQVMSSDRRQLVILMFQALLRYFARAEQAIRRKDFETKGDALMKALAIISELMCSLDDKAGGELAVELRRLYVWLQRQIVEIDLRDDLNMLGNVIAITRQLTEAWEEALRTCQQEESAPRGVPR